MPIKIENLSFSYSKKSRRAKKALDAITLRIEDGDFFGIIGHTGSGKSTLVQHLNALIKIQEGDLIVDEFDLSKKFNYKDLRARVGMVFQYPEYQLFEETVEKDVAFGPKNLGLDDDEVRHRVQEAITLVGLDYNSIRGKSPFELSGGQKRRAAIAGVIAMRPKILVLDEPTAGLDPAGKKSIMQLIHDIKGQCSPTIILISHNMDEIAQNCTKIAVLVEGTVKEVLPPDQLFANSEMLVEWGLDIPEVTKLALALYKRGVDISPSIYKESELCCRLVDLFCQKGEAVE